MKFYMDDKCYYKDQYENNFSEFLLNDLWCQVQDF